jgi:competence transcription factor ComK
MKKRLMVIIEVKVHNKSVLINVNSITSIWELDNGLAKIEFGDKDYIYIDETYASIKELIYKSLELRG